MADKPRKKLSCAIYTRKSSDEGLEQDFNSLDAQREACEAYIASQKHEGWAWLAEIYDDGGISGATLDRPALQRLLADIEARKVDVVVVYKVDRLTRTLADFAKIVEIFDAHKVSFVSVTQQFNTTTSMGRLTLNVLLSFAQFEREVTAERIRDKIAASKKKGMWMGGNVPLGYDAKNKALIINPAEAKTVRKLFALYHFLQNPIYIGQIRHKKNTYPGLHSAIIDKATWDSVQRRIGENRVARRERAYAREPSPLAGLLFDDNETPFTPTHAVKKGKRYRYYVERGAIRNNGSEPRRRYRRFAATEIESVVIGAITMLLQAPTKLLEAIGIPRLDASATKSAIAAASCRATELGSPEGLDRHLLMRKLLLRVTVGEEQVEIRLSREALREAVGITEATDEIDNEAFSITVPVRLRPRGVELKFVILDPAFRQAPKMDPTLIRGIVRANAWFDGLITGKFKTLRDIANREKLPERYVRRILELAFLSPDITEAVLDGRQPEDMMLEELVAGCNLPLAWPDQGRLLRFA
ncbi:MAG: recombinase family protein [Proteobacteria bacterium]|nr:recombinase family protein [Pseudomonadota bacterium]